MYILKSFIEWFTSPGVLIMFLILSFGAVMCCVLFSEHRKQKEREREEAERRKRLDMFN